MPRIRIFPAKKKHITELDEINRSCLPENYPEEYWIELISHHLSWIVQINNKTVGYIIIDRTVDDNGKVMTDSYLIISIAILEEYRRLGCAQKLMQEVILKLKKIKAKSLKLHVRINNLPAQNLYSKFEFIITNKLVNYYTDPIENGLEMTKTF